MTPEPATSGAVTRLRRWSLLAFPTVFLLWLYREGLDTWFFQDDFAWLTLLSRVHSWQDAVRILFEPAAQGTIRPWSERGFFMALQALFGVDNFPFRVVVFATAAADLLLIGSITRRITGSRTAAAVAGVAWAANASLVTAMTWSSAWNEVLCPLFLLSALALFIRYAETGRRIFWWAQLGVFLLGFGALEINIVYPAIALAWCLFVAPAAGRPKLALSTAPLWAISIAYFFFHRAVAPIPKSGVYALHLDSSILTTLGLYVRWSLLPSAWATLAKPRLLGEIILGAAVGSLLVLAWLEYRRHRLTALFFPAWFLITLAPLLPLSEHRTEYYLTIPVIGLGMFAGWSFECAWRHPGTTGNRKWQIWPATVIALYLTGMIPVARAATVWRAERSEAVRVLVQGVEAAHRAHPDQAVVLDGITTELYDNALGHSALHPLGIDEVYLTPGSELNLHPVAGLADLTGLVLEPAVLDRALTTGRVVIYSVSGDHLRNITEVYRRSAPGRLDDQLPSRVDLGNSLYSWLAGPEWLPLEAGFRWMPHRATVRMGFPVASGMKLALHGYCPEVLLQHGPRTVTVLADGVVLGETKINHPESEFDRLFPIPSSLMGRKSVEVEIQVDPTERYDNRDLGLIFGRVAVIQ